MKRRKGAQNETGTFVSDCCVINQQKQVQFAELAELFEVSVRTIYRDIDTINRAGIPIVTSQGAGGGIGIMETYRLERVAERGGAVCDCVRFAECLFHV